MDGKPLLRVGLGLSALAVAVSLSAGQRALAEPSASAPAAPAAVTYDIVYVRQPRQGDNSHITWPEVFHPGTLEPGADLMLLHPDGSEEVLVDTTDGAVTDPFVSFDGQYIYYSFFPDVRPSEVNYQRGDLPYAGADIYRMHLPSRDIVRLTHQEFTPNTGAGHWDESNPVDPPGQYNRLGYGILNLGPAPLPGGKIVFVSNRTGFVPPKGYTNPTLQLFVMDFDGANVTPIAPMTIGSALHPTPLADGRIMFSTFETQGLRDSRNWGLWVIWPDGRGWGPLVSSFKQAGSFHFATQLSDGDVVVEDYYNLNNWGFGSLYRFPIEAPAGEARFYSADLDENPPIAQVIGAGFSYPFRMSFTPRGLHSITPFTHGGDEAAPLVNPGDPNSGPRVGKFTHPSAAPNNDLLVAWSPGPANALNRPVDLPAVDAGLYLLPAGGPIAAHTDLVPLKNDPNYNEVWPRAVVSYQAMHGVAEPALLPWLPNDGALHPTDLPAGTPFGLIGTSSFYRRESAPGFGDSLFSGLDAFNTSQNDASSNWSWQGADAGAYTDADIWAVRIVALEANTHRSYGPHLGQHFFNHVNEKMRILGEIPLRKFDGGGQPILDPDGNPDTSFLAKIPADTPFTFQMLDRNGLVLTMAQTWHQVRPGEARYDCGGCHAHSQLPLDFFDTAAGQPGYPVWDLTETTPLLTHDSNGDPDLTIVPEPAVNVEFYQDVRPILQNRCVSCHTGPAAPGNLRLDETTEFHNVEQFTSMQAPRDYMRLCRDEGATWGYPPLVQVGGDPVWRQTNASRYVRLLQSRRSLLMWQVFGARLDGWTNATNPTETMPGDVNTLPGGASNINRADLNYNATGAHPAGVGVAGMTIDEKMTLGRWIDLGCPINTGEGDDADYGWFVDDNKPTLEVSLPRAGMNPAAVTQFRVGVADAYTGIAPGSLSITTTLAVAGRPAGSQLADLFVPNGDGSIYTLVLGTPITHSTGVRLYAQVADQQGNVTRVVRTFSVHNFWELENLVFLPGMNR